MAEKTTKPARKRVASPRAKKRHVEHAKIAERAYFIYLDEGRGDSVDHWLRAERELATA